jgi:hypothetical protein
LGAASQESDAHQRHPEREQRERARLGRRVQSRGVDGRVGGADLRDSEAEGKSDAERPVQHRRLQSMGAA